MTLRVQGTPRGAELGRLPAGCPRVVETLQSVVTPDVELFSGIFGQVSGQQKHYFINKLRKGVWIATAERLHKAHAPVYFPSWRTSGFKTLCLIFFTPHLLLSF